MHDENHSGPGYFSGLVAGLLFGAVAGLLLAPKRGRELRDDLAQEAETLKERAKTIGGSVATAAQDVKAHGAEILSTAKTAGNMLKDEAAGHVEQIKASVTQAASDIRSEAQATVEEARTVVAGADDEGTGTDGTGTGGTGTDGRGTDGTGTDGTGTATASSADGVADNGGKGTEPVEQV